MLDRETPRGTKGQPGERARCGARIRRGRSWRRASRTGVVRRCLLAPYAVSPGRPSGAGATANDVVPEARGLLIDEDADWGTTAPVDPSHPLFAGFRRAWRGGATRQRVRRMVVAQRASECSMRAAARCAAARLGTDVVGLMSGRGSSAQRATAGDRRASRHRQDRVARSGEIPGPGVRNGYRR